MRRQYNDADGQFSEFSSSLVTGDTVILSLGVRMEHLALLLAKGVVVRTPESASLDRALWQDAQGLEAIVRLAAATVAALSTVPLPLAKSVEVSI